MDQYDAFFHKSTILGAIYPVEPAREEFCVGKGKSAVKTKLKFRRGSFQVITLSPLLFCLSTVPISHALREIMGFKVPYPDTLVTHLFFTDDLKKVYAENQEVLGDTLKVVDRVSHAIGMELGLQKCAVAHI